MSKKGRPAKITAKKSIKNSMAPESTTLQAHLDEQDAQLETLRNALEVLAERLIPVSIGYAMKPTGADDDAMVLEAPIAMTIKRQTKAVRDLTEYVGEITEQLQI